MHDIRTAVQSIQERIAAAAQRAGRSYQDIRLMAVSKFHTVEAICEAASCGMHLFGENRAQEAVEKFPDVFARFPQAELHMIGSLQRNKVRMILPYVSCIQSVDRIELLEQIIADKKKLGQAAALPQLSVLFELHTGEQSKSGFASADDICRAVEYLAEQFNAAILPAGFMTMAPFTDDKNEIRSSFRTLVKAADYVRARFRQFDLPILSMGMSNDFETAVEEGSTLVRVGTAIFGERR